MPQFKAAEQDVPIIIIRNFLLTLKFRFKLKDVMQTNHQDKNRIEQVS